MKLYTFKKKTKVRMRVRLGENFEKGAIVTIEPARDASPYAWYAVANNGDICPVSEHEIELLDRKDIKIDETIKI